MDDFHNPGDEAFDLDGVAPDAALPGLTSREREAAAPVNPRALRIDEPSPVLGMAVNLVSSFLANNTIGSDQLCDLVSSVHKRLVELQYGSLKPAPVQVCQKPLVPAVPIENSITDDHVICLEDGRKLKTMRRYLMARYQLTPDQYRERWGLPLNYPMVSPNHSKVRAKLARQNGLGKKRP